ncbi:MAG: hypothetical protein AUK34_05155 [Ignavibacteria bacterium CG2_30_36_16]|nr:MAG: hypothetical protein AUK34_05155 [Ignavibacteria bacterium CG2_30_36_16]PJB01651.1 MAG: hypothetical protein CO127_02680 [Ignavibacteria bacterium CG_4_9_14_3_um_filter_36_18]
MDNFSANLVKYRIEKAADELELAQYCAEKNETIIKYSMLKESKQLFASKYKFYLPKEKDFIEEIEIERTSFERELYKPNL